MALICDMVSTRWYKRSMPIATGSEVELVMAAAEALSEQGVGARVVSMPCVEEFMRQEADYRELVLPADCRARVAVEAAHPDYWYRFVGLDGAVVGIDTFGVSAPGDIALDTLGINAANVLTRAQEVLRSSQKKRLGADAPA